MRKKALSVIMPYVSHGKGKCRPHDGMALPNVRSIYKKIWIETDELIRRKFFFMYFAQEDSHIMRNYLLRLNLYLKPENLKQKQKNFHQN